MLKTSLRFKTFKLHGQITRQFFEIRKRNSQGIVFI